MVLGIDIGNTNIVLGGFSGRRIKFEARMATDLLKTSDQYCAELKSMLGLFDVRVQDVEDVIISSVVPPVLNSFKTAIRKLTGLECMIVGPGLKTGLDIRIDNPRQAGSDLIVAAVAAIPGVRRAAAHRRYGHGNDDFRHQCRWCVSWRLHLPRGQDLPGRPHQPDSPAAGHQLGRAPAGHRAQHRRLHAVRRHDRCGGDAGRHGRADGGGAGRAGEGHRDRGHLPFILPYCRREMHYDKDLLLKGLITLYHNNARLKPKAARGLNARGQKQRIKNAVSPTMLQTPMAAVTMVSSQASGRNTAAPGRRGGGLRAGQGNDPWQSVSS